MSCEASADPGIMSSGKEIDWSDLVNHSPGPFNRIKPIKAKDWDRYEKDWDRYEKDWDRYEKQVKESEGFDVDHFPGLGSRNCRVRPLSCVSDIFVESLSSAIAQHNDQAKVGAPITLQRVVKLNMQSYPGNLFYTFEGTDAYGTKRTYQAKLDMDCETDQCLLFIREKSDTQPRVGPRGGVGPSGSEGRPPSPLRWGKVFRRKRRTPNSNMR